jgi:hypothetical protein
LFETIERRRPKEVAMTTLTHRSAATRHPLVARWELVTDAHGRTRPEMRWELSTEATEPSREATTVTLAA